MPSNLFVHIITHLSAPPDANLFPGKISWNFKVSICSKYFLKTQVLLLYLISLIKKISLKIQKIS